MTIKKSRMNEIMALTFNRTKTPQTAQISLT